MACHSLCLGTSMSSIRQKAMDRGRAWLHTAKLDRTERRPVAVRVNRTPRRHLTELLGFAHDEGRCILTAAAWAVHHEIRHAPALLHLIHVGWLECDGIRVLLMARRALYRDQQRCIHALGRDETRHVRQRASELQRKTRHDSRVRLQKEAPSTWPPLWLRASVSAAFCSAWPSTTGARCTTSYV